MKNGANAMSSKRCGNGEIAVADEVMDGLAYPFEFLSGAACTDRNVQRLVCHGH